MQPNFDFRIPICKQRSSSRGLADLWCSGRLRGPSQFCARSMRPRCQLPSSQGRQNRKLELLSLLKERRKGIAKSHSNALDAAALTQFLVVPGFLRLQKSIKNCSARLDSAKDVIPGANPLKELNIGVVGIPMVRDVCQIHV